MEIDKLAPRNWFRKHGTCSDGFLGSAVHAFKDFINNQIKSLKNFWDNIRTNPMKSLSPTNRAYTVRVDMPGTNKSDISVELIGNTLSIRGSKQQEIQSNHKHGFRIKRSCSSWSRVLSLPHDADKGRIAADYKRGVLTVTIPRKVLPHSIPKPIRVRTV